MCTAIILACIPAAIVVPPPGEQLEELLLLVKPGPSERERSACTTAKGDGLPLFWLVNLLSKLSLKGRRGPRLETELVALGT